MALLLIRGATGADVAALRAALAEQLGADAQAYGDLATGNVLDANVEAAARRWQSGVGLVADGVIGPRCQELLGLRRPQKMAVALDLAHVRALFPATKPSNIERYLPYVAAALGACGLTDRPMICAALGTIRAESEGFLPISEFPSQFNTLAGQAPFSAYEGRQDLGNTKPGDGARFKGRGFVQLTGRDNYEKYGAVLGIDLAANADLANAPEVASLLLARFLADCADRMRAALLAGHYATARKLVNGGSHGLDRFKDVFMRADAAWPAQAAVAAPAAARAPRGKKAPAPAAAKKRLLNASKDPSDLRDRAYSPPPVSMYDAFPTDADVKALLPTYTRAGLVLDQGQEGACTGFGLACVVNYLRWRKSGMPKRMESVSPRMLYNFARRYDEYAGEDYDGSSCRGALKGWFNHGVCLEADWPYADPRARPRYGYAPRAAQQTLGVYLRIELRSITDLQAAIQHVGAVYVSAYTHDGWSAVPAVGSPPKGHADLPVIPFDGRPSETDGHAFALMGFNSNGFVIQNSWGPQWGVGGFAVLSYADWLANGRDAWVVALGVPGVVLGRVGAAGTGATGAAGGANTSQWWSREQAYQHSVVLGNDGRVKRYLTEDELSRTLLHQVAGLPDQWFRSRADAGPRRLVIYAHGGLNSEEAAIQRARAMGRHFIANDCYPVFMVWKTGLLECIGDILGDAWHKEPAKAAGVGEWLTDRTDLLIEKSIGRPLARPVWSEMKENAELAFSAGRGGDLLVTALQKLLDTWGDQFELHVVAHSAGSILLGHLLTALSARRLSAMVKSAHLYAPACTVQFANRHYAPNVELMKRLYIDLLSDRVERNDNVAAVYRKSLLYLVSNALEVDLRTPILGLENAFKEDYAGWDGTSSTGDTLRSWHRAVAEAGLEPGGRLTVLDADKVMVARPDRLISAGHACLDNDLDVIGRTLSRIVGAPLACPPDDLRGF
ncbi:MAG TPA: C1 family peptidase [Burkholderiaceae bacterium]|nr:C1 family peptidase [Burkholderiaceae bacterium]